MANLIRIKGGAGKGTLRGRELAYHTEEKALYIGTADGNVLLCRAEDIDGKLTAQPIAAQAGIGADADITAVIAAVNNLISALKESGIMKTE